jgi:ABC-2 type transport system ATP-binding protein
MDAVPEFIGLTNDPQALHITDLVKRYPTGVEALRGVSVEINAGEFFGLLGPNGAGKSTLIHCTTGLARPTAGEIRVFGHDAINDYAQAELCFASRS